MEKPSDFQFKIWPFCDVGASAAVLHVQQVIADIVAKNDGIERCLEDEFVCFIEHNPIVMLLPFPLCCETLIKFQSKEWEYVLEFPLNHFNNLISGRLGCGCR